MTPEECARDRFMRTGILPPEPLVRVGLIRDGLTLTPEIAKLCSSVFLSVERMLNDEKLKAKIDAQYSSGQMSECSGFDWYLGV